MPAQEKVKIGYALGGGAARGLAHIGVLKVLEEHGVFPDVIAGTSIGAVIGALYAAGMSAADIERLALGIDWKKLGLMSDLCVPVNGLVRGENISRLLDSVLGELSFSRLEYEYACVAADIMTGEEVVLKSGPLTKSVRASISIPGILAPVNLGGRYLVDGGLVCEVPVGVCRRLGADYVIGVNVIPDPAKLSLRLEKPAPEPPVEKTAVIPPETPHLSAHPHLARIENNIREFIEEHRPREIGPRLMSAAARLGRFEAEAPGILDVLVQTLVITEYRTAVANLRDADLPISPPVEGIGYWQFDRPGDAIRAGAEAAREALSRFPLPPLTGRRRPG